MANSWVIKIKKGADGAVFDPPALNALNGDGVTWSNEDDQAHWPAPISNGSMNQTGFMSTQIAPGGSSDTTFIKGSSGTTISYGCALHPSSTETGTITIVS